MMYPIWPAAVSLWMNDKDPFLTMVRLILPCPCNSTTKRPTLLLSESIVNSCACIILPGKVTDIISPSKEEALQSQLKTAEAMDVGLERDQKISEIIFQKFKKNIKNFF